MADIHRKPPEAMEAISRAALLARLKGGITPAERAALVGDGHGLVLSRYNRATLSRMLAMDACPEGPPVSSASLSAMEAALRDYLDRYMPDQPEAHRWIVLSCLFLAFVVQEPLHPQAVVGWRIVEGRYACPAREISGDSLCRWCACGGSV